MVKEAEKLIDDMEGVIGIVTEQFATTANLLAMDADEFQMAQLTLQTMNSFKELVMAEAKAIDEINRKLDMLLEKEES